MAAEDFERATKSIFAVTTGPAPGIEGDLKELGIAVLPQTDHGELFRASGALITPSALTIDNSGMIADEFKGGVDSQWVVTRLRSHLPITSMELPRA
jgi:hypothetical protein